MTLPALRPGPHRASFSVLKVLKWSTATFIGTTKWLFSSVRSSSASTWGRACLANRLRTRGRALRSDDITNLQNECAVYVFRDRIAPGAQTERRGDGSALRDLAWRQGLTGHVGYGSSGNARWSEAASRRVF